MYFKKNTIYYINFMWVFALLGLQMIGNFSALMPLLEDALAIKRNWIKKEDVLDSITWGRCGPGAAVINSVVYLGNKIKGPFAGFLAAVSFCIFPTCVILLIATFASNFMENTYITSMMRGMSVAVVVRLMTSNIDLWKKTMVNKHAIITFLICMTLMFVTPIPTIIYIIGTIVLGIVFVFIKAAFFNKVDHLYLEEGNRR
ncbi:MAG: chromate transporter [Clostridia bacterium]|nr:chromate transporter [Clostridia bacterium]